MVIIGDTFGDLSWRVGFELLVGEAQICAQKAKFVPIFTRQMGVVGAFSNVYCTARSVW